MGKKRKGASQPLPYSMRLQQQKRMLTDREQKAIVHHCLTTIYQASAVALNEEFGFGKERIEKYRDKLNDTMLEFGVLQDDVDTDYAIGSLERRYQQIVKSEE